MSARIRRQLDDEELYSKTQREYEEKRVGKMFLCVSLKDVPLRERRREAKKPLYLVRYE